MEAQSGESPFSNFHHVTIVVRDLEKAMKYYESLGIGPWRDYSCGQYSKVNVKQEFGFFNLTVKEALAGTVWIQLVQPGEGDSIYKDFLNEHGEGVQHLGFVVDDINKEESKLVKAGIKTIDTGRRPDGSGFAYFDTTAIGGTILSIRQNPKDGSYALPK